MNAQNSVSAIARLKPAIFILIFSLFVSQAIAQLTTGHLDSTSVTPVIPALK